MGFNGIFYVSVPAKLSGNDAQALTDQALEALKKDPEILSTVGEPPTAHTYMKNSRIIEVAVPGPSLKEAYRRAETVKSHLSGVVSGAHVGWSVPDAQAATVAARAAANNNRYLPDTRPTKKRAPASLAPSRRKRTSKRGSVNPERILSFMQDRPNDVVTVDDIAEEFQVSHEVARSCLLDLVQTGLVELLPRARYSRGVGTIRVTLTAAGRQKDAVYTPPPSPPAHVQEPNWGELTIGLRCFLLAIRTVNGPASKSELSDRAGISGATAFKLLRIGMAKGFVTIAIRHPERVTPLNVYAITELGQTAARATLGETDPANHVAA